MWNRNDRRLLLKATNVIARRGTMSTGRAACVLLAALALSPVTARAASVVIQVTQNDSGHALCDIICSEAVGNGPQTLAPVAVSDPNTGRFISGAGEVTANTMKMSSSTNAAGGVSLALSDTFTVHGAGSGPTSITAVWHATGTFSSVGVGGGVQSILGATEIRIGTLGSFVVRGDTLYSVAKFAGPDTSKSTSPFNVFSNTGPLSFSADMTAKHTFLADIGSSFDMAFSLVSGYTFGAADFSHTATLSFQTADGVFLTSGLGGTFGDVPVSATPIPAALPLFAGGLGVLGFVARRRKRAAVAAA